MRWRFPLDSRGCEQNSIPVAAETLSTAFYESRCLPGSVFSDTVQGLNIKAFQLFLASYFIANRRYVSPVQGKQFADLLWAQVLGNQLLNGVKRAKDLEPESGGFPRIYKFFGFLSQDIVGTMNPAEAMFLMDRFGVGFDADCLSVVAHAFNDPAAQEAVRLESASLEKNIEELKDRFFKKMDELKETLPKG